MRNKFLYIGALFAIFLPSFVFVAASVDDYDLKDYWNFAKELHGTGFGGKMILLAYILLFVFAIFSKHFIKKFPILAKNIGVERKQRTKFNNKIDEFFNKERNSFFERFVFAAILTIFVAFITYLFKSK